MKTISIDVFEYDELDAKAQEKARDWFYDGVYNYEWWEYIYMDAEAIGLKVTGFDLDRNRHATGKLLQSAEQIAANIMREHGEKTETYLLAAHFAKEMAKASSEDAKDILREDFESNLLDTYSAMLQHESEHMASKEYLEDGIRANEYTFTKDGKRFG